MFRAAIFDMDGTLLDSHWVWERVDQEFQTMAGIIVREDYNEVIEHMTPTQAAEYTISEYGLSHTPEALKDLWIEIAADLYANEVQLKSGAEDLLASLVEHGVKLALATCCIPHLCELALKKHQVYDYFSSVKFSDRMGVNKQAADLYLSCADDLKVPAKECAVFEDIYSPLKAVKQTGMGYFAVEDVNQTEIARRKLQQDADYYIRDYHEFAASDYFKQSFYRKETV